MTAPYPALFKEAKLPSSLTMPSKNIYISSNSATPISAISSDSNTSYIASEGYSAGPISSGDPSLANYGYPLNGQQFQHDISSKSGFHGTDMSAATEMGQGLLSEIYKMQATLQQYQASIVSQQKEIERLTLDLNLYQTIQGRHLYFYLTYNLFYDRGKQKTNGDYRKRQLRV
ncbi:hypothetical protein BDF14DRAFT_1238408 [Spinellus fusiger]|nr:hypothetical protein BDF14DRAFT_1238408 [Spinellus fusiger]